MAKQYRRFPIKSITDKKNAKVSDLGKARRKGFLRFPNEIVEALAIMELRQCETRTILGIARATYGYNREYAYLSGTALKRLTGYPRTRCASILTELHRNGIVIAHSTQKHHYKLNEDVEQWREPEKGCDGDREQSYLSFLERRREQEKLLSELAFFASQEGEEEPEEDDEDEDEGVTTGVTESVTPGGDTYILQVRQEEKDKTKDKDKHTNVCLSEASLPTGPARDESLEDKPCSTCRSAIQALRDIQLDPKKVIQEDLEADINPADNPPPLELEPTLAKPHSETYQNTDKPDAPDTENVSRETSVNQNTARKNRKPSRKAPEQCPYEAILTAWETVFSNREKPWIARLTPKLKGHMNQRWREGFEILHRQKQIPLYTSTAEGIVWWEKFFRYCKSCPMLLDGDWFTFHWIVKSPDNFSKILSGYYERGRRA